MMYSHSKIYKLQVDDGYFYIGSTCNELRIRLRRHKDLSKYRSEQKVYKHINNEWDKVKIILIEAFSCNNKDELRKKEDEYIQKELENNLCLNNNRAYQTEEEHKEYNRKFAESWRKENPEESKLRKKESRQKHKEQIKEYMKKYREEHKEQIKLKTKEYVEKNRDTINEKRRLRRKKNKILS